MATEKQYVVGSFCFLPSKERGLWVRTDRCVAFVKCPECKAAAGVMCEGKRSPTVRTHYARRRFYTATKRHVDSERRRVVIMEMKE